jgi:hypothetical protein
MKRQYSLVFPAKRSASRAPLTNVRRIPGLRRTASALRHAREDILQFGHLPVISQTRADYSPGYASSPVTTNLVFAKTIHFSLTS